MRRPRFKILVRAIVVTTLAADTADGDTPFPPARQAELAALLATTAAGRASAPAESARVAWSADGFVRYLGAPTTHPFPVTGVAAGQPELAVRRFLLQFGPLLGGQSPAMDFHPIKLSREP